VRERGLPVSMLSHCLEWDKLIPHTHLPTPAVV